MLNVITSLLHRIARRCPTHDRASHAAVDLQEVASVAGNPRNGRPYRRLCAQQRALGLPCWICGREIDYSLTGYAAQRSRWAFTLDHAVPLTRGGDLLDPANARSAHRRCNSARGNRSTHAKVERASRRW